MSPWTTIELLDWTKATAAFPRRVAQIKNVWIFNGEKHGGHVIIKPLMQSNSLLCMMALWRNVYTAHGRKMFDHATDGFLIRGYVKATGTGLAGPDRDSRFILHSEATAWLP